MKLSKPGKIAKLILFTVGLFFILNLLFGCNEQKKCARIKAHHPECFKTELVPTEIIRNDTMYRTYEKVDTVFFMNQYAVYDTFIVVTPKVKTTIIRLHDTLVVTNDVKPDTIIRTIIKTVREYKNPVADKWWYRITNKLPQVFNWLIFFVVLITVGAIVIKVKNWLGI